ncbi:MAG: hypothetical protein HUU16_21430 [Candidatus Omnitrophica bacterium]|nr:hypothetical protein [bacterium]NUN98726.1 hypothetical protein [Candidatus Omnitrophota bacterium]
MVENWMRLLIVAGFLAFPFMAPGQNEDGPLSINFVDEQPKEDEPIQGGSVIEGPAVEDQGEPEPPAALEPIPNLPAPSVETIAPPTPTPAPIRSEPMPAREIRESPPARTTSPPVIRSQEPSPRLSTEPDSISALSSSVVVELQSAKTGQYEPRAGNQFTLQAGERLRWKHGKDQEWRVLEAYGPTEVRLLGTHYEVAGNFFHSFRDGSSRVQVPSLREARDRRDHPRSIDPRRANLKLFVEVSTSAPNAPPPDGNCVVWQKGNLWLNDLVAGEVDSALSDGQVDHLEVAANIPGLIFKIVPPADLLFYAVRVDFEGEIFKELGRLKGQADAEIERVGRLMQMADTPERRLWCEARLAYEQEKSTFWGDRQRFYDFFLRNELDAFGLVRSGHPLPHIELARAVYRHSNLELSVGIFSDHLGKVLLPADAFLWINEAVPITGTPFAFTISDKSTPSFMGFDTRFRGEQDKLAAEEKFSGSTAWVPRNVVVDIYRYATFRPPQPDGPPAYLVDVTLDITGGLKRLNKDQSLSARLGTIQLTPDQFKVEMAPDLLAASGPIDKIVGDIILGPLGLRDWYAGRRSHLHDLFEKVPMLPDEIVDELEEAADELGMRVYELEKPKRASSGSYVYEPHKASLTLSRTTVPGELRLEVVLQDEAGESVRVDRVVRPKIDVIDFAARSVAINRGKGRLEDFRPMTLAEWLDSRKPRSLLTN